MENQKQIYKKQEIIATLLTSVQTILISNIFSLVVLHPIKALFNPINIVQSLYDPKTMFYATSGLVFIYAKFVGRKHNLSFFCRTILFALSHFLFTSNFLAGTNLLEGSKDTASFFQKKISINVCYLFNLLVSLIAGVLCTVRYSFLTNPQTFTHTGGLVFYLIKSSQGIFNSIMNFYFLDLLFSYWFVAFYSFFLRFILNVFFILFRIQLVYHSLLSLFNHIILSNTSVLVYYLLMEIIDRLIVFNTSILNKQFADFYFYDDIDMLRYSFHQVSGLSYKYTYVCRKVSRSQSSLVNLEDYITVEFASLKKVLDSLIAEHKALENKLWITVPQVDKATERQATNENVSSHKQHNFTKKFKTYGILDRYISRIGYFFKVRALINDFNKQMYYVERIDKFINFLVKHRDCYLLLGEFDRRYSELYKNLLESIKKTEKECGVDFKIKI
ncbi:hypothetical protein NGRA_0477 [Nosema granulosis]|uniref:Uncharacterized protein n=1 Tax=Nosema granulosis TaxID=83296 RepID=A0A9P6H2Y8_9MICR|nr:hypothetical protein NGRA_0477 [Nosema granulosis]